MAFTINTNISALQSYYSLAKTNAETIKAQLRVSSGKRILHVADDTSGYNIGLQLKSKSSVMKAQLNNVSSTKDYLSTAESALIQVNDLLIKLNGKYSDSQNPISDKKAIANDIRSIAKEIDSIMKNTKFNGKNLLAESDGSTLSSTDKFGISGSDFTADFASSTYLNADAIKTKLHGGTVLDSGIDSYTGNNFADNTMLNAVSNLDFTVEATFSDGSSGSFQFTMGAATTLMNNLGSFTNGLNSLGITVNSNQVVPLIHNLTLTAPSGKNIRSLTTTSGMDITSFYGVTRQASDTTSESLLDTDTDTVINAAKDISGITQNVKSALGRIGNLTQTLDYRGELLNTSIASNESSISRLFDADIAEEQMKAVRGNILGQIGTSMLSVLNFAPQQILSLFR